MTDVKWSTQLKFSQSGNSRSSTLTGDKILLPPSALKQLLSAAASDVTQRSRHNLAPYDPFNTATHAAYQQVQSQDQDERKKLLHPMTFRLVNPQNGRIVYAGIREFSAEEGEVVLSPFINEALIPSDTGSHPFSETADGNDQQESITITVHACQLPKGTFVKLRPLAAGYDPDDWKALLEKHLRDNYTTLTNAEVLVVPYGRGLNGYKDEYRFLVDGFTPQSDGVCIVDTDLEVDIEALSEQQARDTLKQIADKIQKVPGTAEDSSPGGEVGLFHAEDGQVLPGEYVDYELPAWDRSQVLVFELSSATVEDDVDLLVSPVSSSQRSRPRIDQHVFANFDARPTKRIRLEPSNVELENAKALYVAVHRVAPSHTLRGDEHDAQSSEHPRPVRFTLRVQHPSPDSPSLDGSANGVDTPANPDDVRCDNCRQWVPKTSLMLHQNFCLRNNIRCTQGCGQIFQRGSSERSSHWHCHLDSSYGNTTVSLRKHNFVHHPAEPLRCPECSTLETFHSIPSLARHRTSTCPAKLILCRFCHLVVPQEGDPDMPNAEALISGMTPHELADSARTTDCYLCARIVRLRDMDAHLRNHNLDRLARPPPVPCRNVLCARTRDTCSASGNTRADTTKQGRGPGSDVGLCGVCFGPLYVSMYDPDNRALRRRIERRYLQQLLTGCGKSHCRNEFCKSGRKHVEPPLPGDINTKEALPLIKPFVDGLASAHELSPLHFCVEEGQQRRRALAELMAAEDLGPGKKGGWSLEWCIGALEASDGDLDKARTWLRDWGVRRDER